ncbi:MAG: PduL/EutD family phosphate acyltransferase [Bacilli bacterium]
MKIIVGVSARHIHLDEDTKNILFGSDYVLSKKCDLYQTGEYACNETVTIRSKDGEFNNVRVLGPLRKYNQIEISKSDAFKLKINPPVRDSGDLIGSESLEVESSINKVMLNSCVIIPCRHIHINKGNAAVNNICSGDVVSIKKDGVKGGVLENVHIKVSDLYNNEIHIDTDDANAFLISNKEEMEVIL